MAKMVSFRPNHKIFGGFFQGQAAFFGGQEKEKKKKYTEILRKDQI
jgi:hypothetical protein